MGDLPKLDDLPPLGFTERELFSIYLKYSEIDFDADAAEIHASKVHNQQHVQNAVSSNHSSPEQKDGEGVDSSPASHHGHDHDHDHDSSRLTDSTTHTTPLKHLMMRDERRSRTEYTQFLADLDVGDLLPDLLTYLKSLASQIVEIGGHLQHYQDQDQGNQEEAEDVIIEAAGQLMQLIESSTQNCSGQVANIEWVKELAAFTFTPTDVALWSNYRQRMDSVTRFVPDLVCCQELTLVGICLFPLPPSTACLRVWSVFTTPTSISSSLSLQGRRFSLPRQHILSSFEMSLQICPQLCIAC